MEELIHFDKELLLWFNGSDSLVMDSIIMTLTTATTWIPLYLALFYLFSDRIWLRKIGFFGGIIALLLFLIGNLFAWQQKSNFSQRTGAIIIKSAVNVKSTPSKNGTDLYILHEGTKVTVTDSSMREWRKIRVADGKEGWLEVSEIEVI